MGNWYRIKLEAEGLDKLDIFTDGKIDFDKIIPMPADKKSCSAEYLLDEYSGVGPLKQKPWINWYKWRMQKWGVCFYSDGRYRKKGRCIMLETKDVLPIPAIEKLSGMLGQTELTISWQPDSIFSPVEKRTYVNGRRTGYYISFYDDSSEEYGPFQVEEQRIL